MPVYFTSLVDGEAGEPATWNSRLTTLETAILALADPNVIKFVPSTIVTVDTPTIVISAIPQTARHLVFYFSLICDAVGLQPKIFTLKFNAIPGDAEKVDYGNYSALALADDDTGQFTVFANGYDVSFPAPQVNRVSVLNYRSILARKGGMVDDAGWYNISTARRIVNTGRSLGMVFTDPITTATLYDPGGTMNIKAGSVYSVLGIK